MRVGKNGLVPHAIAGTRPGMDGSIVENVQSLHAEAGQKTCILMSCL
jgi:hypothetical protein